MVFVLRRLDVQNFNRKERNRVGENEGVGSFHT
jgi:hypothetical protein